MKKLFGILSAAAFAVTLGVACGGGATTPAGDSTIPTDPCADPCATDPCADPCATDPCAGGTMMKSDDGMMGDPCGGSTYGGSMYGGDAYGSGW
jgi:hypothetical protein